MKEREILDIFDEHRNLIGTAERGEAHARGLWHQTFQCWVLSREGGTPSLLFQLRHPDKDTFPNLLDISCAGHLQAGETPEDGLRELEEELGATARFEELIPCGVFADETVISEKLIDREFCHVFVYPSNLPVEAYRLQPDEVTGLFRIALEDVRSLVYGEAEQVCAAGVETDASGVSRPVLRTVTRNDLTPHRAAYYDMLFAAIAGSQGSNGT